MQKPASIPSTRQPDTSLAFLREGYEYIRTRCRAFGTDAFRTRLMLSDVVCMSGIEAAEKFYGSDNFTRDGAMPWQTVKLLQDRGSVEFLEDEAHHARKAMFIDMMSDEAMARLDRLFIDEWTRRIPHWQASGRIVLFDEVREMLTKCICQWAGVPVEGANLTKRNLELSEMIEKASTRGPKVWRALWLRRRNEVWARDIIERLRKGTFVAPEGSPVHRIAFHRDPDGSMIAPEAAAVELINVLRPTVAVGRFMVFVALALHRHPEWAERFASGHDEDIEPFTHEVRRLAPFFAIIGGRVRKPFDWHGAHFRRGQWVLLDLYGTCRDARAFPDPETFRPERFRDAEISPFSLVPQGGGVLAQSHRCPGEWITIRLLNETVKLLTREMTYDVPAQDLSVDLRHLPATPKSGFVIANVQPKP